MGLGNLGMSPNVSRPTTNKDQLYLFGLCLPFAFLWLLQFSSVIEIRCSMATTALHLPIEFVTVDPLIESFV